MGKGVRFTQSAFCPTTGADGIFYILGYCAAQFAALFSDFLFGVLMLLKSPGDNVSTMTPALPFPRSAQQIKYGYARISCNRLTDEYTDFKYYMYLADKARIGNFI